MASHQSTVDFILEQAKDAGQVAAKKMFGEYGLYCNGTMVALVCEDQLVVKPTAAGRALLREVTEAPPYKGAKPCFLIAGEHWDDCEWLSELFRVSAAALPATVKKRRAKSAATAR